jgi:hypothetical protein
MASKVNIARLAQENLGWAQLLSGRLPRDPALTALRLRVRRPKLLSLSKVKRLIPVLVQEPLDIPQPIRIIHLQPASAAPQPASNSTLTGLF